MPQLLPQLRSLLNRLRETLFKNLFRARFRYDVFISYSHRDAKEYAVNLKKQLNNLDFSCFIDEEESPPGSSLDPTLAKALRRSAVLVLLATERALTRPYIMSEFEKFAATQRTIVPINILGALTSNNEEALTRSPWNVINERKLVWIDESDEAFNKKNPSPPIADGIDKLFKYTRRNVRVRAEIIGTAVLVVLAALGAGFVIKGQAKEVRRQSDLAVLAKQETEKQQTIAGEARNETQRQVALGEQAKKDATQQRELAEAARTEAERQQEIARVATAQAQEQQRLAKVAKAEADRQQTIAHARQLANQAELARGVGSDDLFTSASLAIRSLELHPTLEGDLAIRKDLSLLPSSKSETRYPGKLTAGVASPNATALAFLVANSEIEIWKGKDVLRKSKPASHTLLALSNDGQYFVTAGGSTALIQNTKTAQTWDITLFEESNIRAIALSAEGKYLAIIASADEGMWVEVWERDSKKMIGRPMRGSFDSSELHCLAFSSDNDQLLAVGGNEKHGGGMNGFVRTWTIRAPGDPNTGYSFDSGSTLRLPLYVTMVAVTSKDNYLLTANDNTAVVWKRKRLGDHSQIARIPLQHPLAVAFDKGPQHVHVVSQRDGWIDGAPPADDKRVLIWEASGLQEYARVTLDEEIMAVSFRQDRDLLMTVSETHADDYNGLRFWDPLSIKEKEQGDVKLNHPEQFDFSGDSNYLAAADEHGVIRVWNLKEKSTFDDIATNPILRSIHAIELSWDGEFMAVSGAGSNQESTVVVYERRNRSYQPSAKPLRLPTGTAADVLGLSPDGRLIATETPGVYQIKIWQVATGRDVTPRALDVGSQLRAVFFSPHGESIIAVTNSGNVFVWATATGKTVASFGDSVFAITNARHNVAMSQDGRYIAVGNFDGTARVFELSTGEELARLQHDDPVVSVSFSRDGKFLATATSAQDPDTAQRQSYSLWTWLIQPPDLIAETCKRSPRVCKEYK